MCTAGIQFLINVGEAAPVALCEAEPLLPAPGLPHQRKNDAFIDFNWADFGSTNGYTSTPTISNSSPTTNGPTYYHERFLVGGLTTTHHQPMVNEVHGQWGRDLETAGANDAGPVVAIGAVTFGMPNALPRIAEPDEHRIQVTDVLELVEGPSHLQVRRRHQQRSRSDDQPLPGRRHLQLRRHQQCRQVPRLDRGRLRRASPAIPIPTPATTTTPLSRPSTR